MVSACSHAPRMTNDSLLRSRDSFAPARQRTSTAENDGIKGGAPRMTIDSCFVHAILRSRTPTHIHRSERRIERGRSKRERRWVPREYQERSSGTKAHTILRFCSSRFLPAGYTRQHLHPPSSLSASPPVELPIFTAFSTWQQITCSGTCIY